MIFPVIIFTLFASISSASINRLNTDMIREIFSFGQDVQQTLSLTCSSFYRLSREEISRYWSQKGMPYFSELPYHPDWEMIADFPPPNDLISKARHLMMTVEWISRAPKKSLMHQRVEVAIAREISTTGQPLIEALMQVTSEVKIFHSTLLKIVPIILANDDIVSFFAIHRHYRLRFGIMLPVSMKSLRSPMVMDALKAESELLFELLLAVKDILHFLIFEIDCGSQELAKLLPSMYAKFGVDALYQVQLFFTNINSYDFVVNLDVLKVVYDYFSTRDYPRNLLGALNRELESHDCHPHSKSIKRKANLLRAFNARDYALFLSFLNAESVKLFEVYDFAESELEWMKGMLNETAFQKYFLCDARLRSFDISFLMAYHRKYETFDDFLRLARPDEVNEAAAILLDNPEPNRIVLFLERASVASAQAFARDLLHNLPQENALEMLNLICSVKIGAKYAKRLRPKLIYPTKPLLTLFLENPGTYEVFKANSFKLKLEVHGNDSLELILKTDTLARLLLAGASFVTDEKLVLKHLSWHTFERAVRIFHLDSMRHCEVELNGLLMNSFHDVMSIVLLAKVWRKHNPARFEQVRDDPAAKSLIENNLLFTREHLRAVVDYFTPDAWETVRVFLSSNRNVFEAVRLFISHGVTQPNFVFLEDDSDDDDFLDIIFEADDE